jgi:elongation factor Ts
MMQRSLSKRGIRESEDILPKLSQEKRQLKWVKMTWATSWKISKKKRLFKGGLDKRLKELCLMDQPYIRDQNISVEELVKQTTLQIGQKMSAPIPCFVLGEGIEKGRS